MLHARRYPAMTILDVYKLLHQAVFGEGHAIPNRKAAREWLDHEAGFVVPDRASPLIESAHPDGAVVRLHLGAYLGWKGNLAGLLDAHMRSSEVVRGDATMMARHWATFASMIGAGGALVGRFEVRSVALMGRARAAEDWPSTPHSPAFITTYRPTYRVLIHDQALDLLRAQSIVVPDTLSNSD